MTKNLICYWESANLKVSRKGVFKDVICFLILIRNYLLKDGDFQNYNQLKEDVSGKGIFYVNLEYNLKPVLAGYANQ